MRRRDDEHRPNDLPSRGHLQRLLRDPETAIRKYIGLLARSARWEGERKALTKRLQEAERKGRRAAADRKAAHELTARVGQLAERVDALSRENARLKADLKRVRTSRAMTIGRSVLAPARIVRRALRDGASATQADELTAPVTAATVESQGVPERAEAAQAKPTTDELLAALAAEPSPVALERALGALWFGEGEITRPAALIEAHPEIARDATGKLDDLIHQVVAADRALREGYWLPPRAAGAAMRTVPGRVMYCAHSTPAFGSNGYSIRTGGVANGLAANDVDVVVVARAGYPWDSGYTGARRRTVVELDGVDYVHHPGASLNHASLVEAVDEAADAFLREARRQRPALIHAASNYLTAMPALLTARRLGVPFVYEVRGLWELSAAAARPGWEASERYALQVRLEDLVMREADQVLAITTQVAEALVDRGVPRDRIALLPNAVDTLEQTPLPADDAYARKLGIPRDVPWVGFAGSMVAYEGLDLLLEAAAILRDQGRALRLVLAGGGAHESALRARASELALDDMVHFVGRRPHEEMPRLLSLFDVMPCPRLDQAVTRLVSPLKPLEAFANGRAVVLSDVAPHRDLAGSDQERALLFEAGSAQGLAAAIGRVLEDGELRERLARAGRLWAARERQWRTVCVPVVAAYRRLVAHAPEAGPSLSEIRIGLIADEFTAKTIAGSAAVELLDRGAWRSQLDGLTFVIVESAWAGNGGQWERGIGFYSAEEHADIRALLAACRGRGIPTVFWNKEDPVHTKRFMRTAALCDHVFTVDADLVREYHRSGRSTLRSVSGMPFYAQPAIHHPLGSAADDDAIAYAGTYYGDRYPDRTRSLRPLLKVAKEVGLAIYDRQASNPASPYRFPEDLQECVRGSLPYDEVIETYRSHLAHLNVNSVPDSPTMFSRRVVEIAASGGVVLSGPSRALGELFPASFPVGVDRSDAQGYMHLWALDPAERRAEAWRQMRAVLRAYTADDAITIMARAAGIPVSARPRPDYAVQLIDTDGAELLDQSVLPALVVGPAGGAAARALRARGVEVVERWSDAQASPAWIAASAPNGETWFEDLMLAAQFGEWDRIDAAPAGLPGTRALARTGAVPQAIPGLIAADVLAGARVPSDRSTVVLALSVPAANAQDRIEVVEAPTRLLIAGHDLKFIEQAIPGLEARGFAIETDRWENHVTHDHERSAAKLADADVVLAEWALGNSVWFGERKRVEQRLVVRVHMQELRRPYLARAARTAVDDFVFVSETVRRTAALSHGVALERSRVIPNFVDSDALDLPKLDGANRRIGLVGYVPQMKRLDRALDVIERVLEVDPSRRLVVKGRRPEDYPWMRDRPEELAYYAAQMARADEICVRHPGAVVFEGYGEDMPQWYRSVGAVLSVSDFESFHYTVADGAASGARPLVLAWGGSDLVYPGEWLHADVASVAAAVLEPWSDGEAAQAKAAIAERYSTDVVLDALARTLRGAP